MEWFLNKIRQLSKMLALMSMWCMFIAVAVDNAKILSYHASDEVLVYVILAFYGIIIFFPAWLGAFVLLLFWKGLKSLL